MPLIRAFRTPVWEAPAVENKLKHLNGAIKKALNGEPSVPRVLEIASEWVFYGDAAGCDSWSSLSADGECDVSKVVNCTQ